MKRFSWIKERDFDKRIEKYSGENIPFYPIQCAQAFQTFRLISTLRFLAARKGNEPANGCTWDDR